MRTIYINSGQKNNKMNGPNWKMFMFLILFMVLIGSTFKVTAPIMVEKWINHNGAGDKGYAFSIRDVDFSLAKSEMILRDLKIFNPKTSTELLEATNLTIHLNWTDFLLTQDKKISIYADKVDVILSKDFSSEMARIKAGAEKQKTDFYLDAAEGKINKLNIIVQKEDQSRTVLELNDVNVKLKDVDLLSINKKTEFNLTSNLADGGKFSLSGKTREENGNTPWSIHGLLKQVPADIFNKMTGGKLPFSFNVTNIDAQISAHSSNGKVSGEITPDVKILNLLEERPGIPAQSIARALNDELTFTLPFTLKDELTLEYADTYRKLKNYRKYAASAEKSRSPDIKKSHSFWSFAQMNAD